LIKQLTAVIVGCAALLTLVAGLAGTASANRDSGPICPTESDCRPIYADGRWTIVADAD
jgi:hypothetical protein